MGLRAAVIVGLGIALAQTPQTPPTFRSGIDVVRVDVSVLDAARRPIADLKQADFAILVDGQPQPIASFDPVLIPPVETATAPWMREVTPDVRSNALGEPRLIVILMDDATTPTDPRMVRTAKEIANRIVDELGPSDLAAIVFTLDNSHSQDFTNDRRLLREAVDHFRYGIRGTDLPQRYAQRALAETLKFLRARSHGRSAVMLLSASPVSTEDTTAAGLDTPLTGAAQRLNQLSVAANIESFGGPGRYAPVPIYSFNIAGLVAPYANAAVGERPGGIKGDEKLYTLDEATFVNDVMRTMADMTGGRAVVDDADPARAVPSILQEMSAYYTIGYRATYPVADGKSHRLQIRVNRPGVTVLPSDRVMTSERPAATSRAAPPPLVRAVSDLVPTSELPMAVTLAPFAVEAPGGTGLGTAVLTTLHVRRAAPAAAATDEIHVLAKAFTPEGKQVASVQQKAALKLREADEDARLDILTVIPVKPGRYNFRFSAHSVALDRTGSVYTDIVVPDFAKEPLSLSGVLIAADPAPIAAPKDAFAKVVPVVPTSEREFAPAEHAAAFLRVYQRGGAPAAVEITTRVIDASGKDAASASAPIDAAQFSSGRGADYRYDLPLASLAPGSYLLTIRATLGNKNVERDVRFTVR